MKKNRLVINRWIAVSIGVIVSLSVLNLLFTLINSFVFSRLPLFSTIIIFTGLLVLFKESVIALKLFCASIIMVIVVYLYSFLSLLEGHVSSRHPLFFIVGWSPILFGIVIYILIVKYINKRMN